MSEFDSKRALREEIEGLSNILTTIGAQASQAEMRAGEAAQQFDSLLKLKAYAQSEVARKRKVLQEFIEQEQRSQR